MAELSDKNFEEDLDKFVEEKKEHVIWKTEEGAKQLHSIVQYKIDNPSVSVRTLCEYLIKKCNWTYSQRYIFDLIVQRVEAENDK